MRVALECKLTGYACWEAFEDGCVGCAEVLNNVVDFLVVGNFVEFGLVGSEHVVEFCNEFFDCGDELDEAFGNEYGSEVATFGCACCNGLCNVGYDVVECLLLGFNLLTDEGDVGLSLECALECYVASGAAHEFDEVPIFFG